MSGPVLLHVVTEKGRGAPEQGNDAAHAVSGRKPAPATEVGASVEAPKSPRDAIIKYQDAFARAVHRVMEHDPRVVAITAAMPSGTGLSKIPAAFQTRVVDVGICEQHGVAVAAGMADLGMKPVVAIYSTFLQRAYDQVWQEVVVQDLPVVLAMDRAGIVGGDGVTHQGLYDIAYLRTFPGVMLMAPADPPELEAMLRHALKQPGPTAIRYPRGGHEDRSLEGNDPKILTGKGITLRRGNDVAFFAYGAAVRECLRAAELLARDGIEATVFNARFARPLDARALERLVASHPLMLTVEEHARQGGFGAAVLEHLSELETPPACTSPRSWHARSLGSPRRGVGLARAIRNGRSRFGPPCQA